MTQRHETASPDIFKLHKDVSNKDFLTFGIEDIAYVRPVMIEDRKAFAIHAADGTPLSVVESEDSALATIHDNDMDPVRLH